MGGVAIVSDLGVLSRTELVLELHEWIGTPYHHQASHKGVGCDCLGLVRGLYRFLYGREAEAPPAYSQDWSGDNPGADLLAAARRHLQPQHPNELMAGDVVVFRLRRSWPAKHCGVLSAPNRFVHAVSGRCVSEVGFSPWWHRHMAGCFVFPGVTG